MLTIRPSYSAPRYSSREKMFRDNYSRLYITVLFLMDKKIGAGLKKKQKNTCPSTGK